MSRLPIVSLSMSFACSPTLPTSLEAPTHCSSLTEVLDDGGAPPRSAPEPSGLIYEIYVRSYQDSDGDGIGDLNGVAQRLDHLASLGVETIWLMPVFEASAVAGYGVTSFGDLW